MTYRIVVCNMPPKWHIKRWLYKCYVETWNRFVRQCRFYKSTYYCQIGINAIANASTPPVVHHSFNLTFSFSYAHVCLPFLLLLIIFIFFITWYTLSQSLRTAAYTNCSECVAEFRCLTFHLVRTDIGKTEPFV